MTALFLRMTKIWTLGVAAMLALAVSHAEPISVEASQFSGKPVPRFESLRYSAVHGRQGPSLDHPILWRYEREGLPVLVVRETHGWRRVRDPDGDEVWVQARMLSEVRTVILVRDDTLFKDPDREAGARASIKSGVIAELDTCSLGWCSVRVGRTSGWIVQDALWGTQTETGGA